VAATFEYKFIVMSYRYARFPWRGSFTIRLTRQANSLAGQGWELIGVTALPSTGLPWPSPNPSDVPHAEQSEDEPGLKLGEVLLTFKRPKEPE